MIAENARAQPDAVDHIKRLLATLPAEIAAFTMVASEILTGGSELERTGRELPAMPEEGLEPPTRGL